MERSQSSGAPRQARYGYLDWLRIAAAFGIIVLHMTPLASLEVKVSSPAWTVMNVCSNSLRASVALFFMISGALFLDPQKPVTAQKLFKKTIPRMLISFFFWSAIYAVAHCLLYGLGKWAFLNQLFRGHYHMWYIFTITSLYLITPILRRVTESKKLTEYLLVSGFVLTFVCARVLGFIQLFNLPHADVVASVQSFYAQINPYRGLYFVLYFVLGHYLHAYPVGEKLRRLAAPVFILCAAITCALCGWNSRMLGETSSYFSDLSSLNVFGMAVSLFVLFQTHCDRTSPALQRLSKGTYGIYLVHAFVIERLSLNFSAQPLALFAQIALGSCAVFLISAAVSAILGRIPVLNRYIV